MAISAKAIEALVNASRGNSVLFVSKSKVESDRQFIYLYDFVRDLSIDYKIEKTERTIFIGEGKISFIPFEQGEYYSRGRRANVFFDELLERDLETFGSLYACEVAYRQKREHAFSDEVEKSQYHLCELERITEKTWKPLETCEYVFDKDIKAWVCSNCGGIEPCSNTVNYCCDCGAEVVG